MGFIIKYCLVELKFSIDTKAFLQKFDESVDQYLLMLKQNKILNVSRLPRLVDFDFAE